MKKDGFWTCISRVLVDVTTTRAVQSNDELLVYLIGLVNLDPEIMPISL